MLKNQLISSWRNLIQNPFSSAINIGGLATGITCCIFIALYVWSEMNVDGFNTRKKDIVRINQVRSDDGRGDESTPYPLGTAMQNEYPAIKHIVRLGQDAVSIRASENAYFYEEKFFWTDSAFFDVFDNKVLLGDAATALKDPHAIVLTQEMATKYFKDVNPIGKTVDVKIYDGDKKFSCTVTAVVETPSKKSAIRFDFLAPMRTAIQVYPQFERFWGLNWVSTYALIDHSSKLPSTQEESDAFYKKYTGENFGRRLDLQPFTSIHLHSGHLGGNRTDAIVNVYVFSVIGVLIFLLACVNFVNISTARAELRKKEIGVRKALGAFRGQLFLHFMTEALLVAGIVMIIALTATTALFPLASGFVDDTSPLLSIFVVPFVFVAALLLIGIFAGFYPAVLLSGFKPLEALKAKSERATGFGSHARQVLVVFQFTISIALIAGTLMIRKQVHFLKEADLGFTQDQLITIPVDDRALQARISTIKELMSTSAGVVEIAATGEKMPAQMNNTWDMTWAGQSPDSPKAIDIVSIDRDYFPLLKAKFVEGRNLSSDHRTDDSSSVIINEAARKRIDGDAIGKEISIGGKKMTIAGVVKDIHHYSLHQKVNPIAYLTVPAGNRACSDNLILRIQATTLPATLASLKQKWETLTQDRPFEYHFVDADFSRSYEQEEQFLSLFEIFSALAIVIACLGLMGLSSFVVTRRAKEIGVRKVLGASIAQIIVMLTKGFSIPIGIAFLIAGPAAYFVMAIWLDKFAYKADTSFLVIVFAGFVAWLIAFSFIGFQSWRAATVNPAKILKDE